MDETNETPEPKDLILANPKEALIQKLNSWGQEVTERQNQAEIKWLESKYIEWFTDFCRESFKGVTNQRLKELSIEQLQVLDQELVRRLIPKAIWEATRVSVASVFIAAVPYKLFLWATILKGDAQVGTTLGSLFATVGACFAVFTIMKRFFCIEGNSLDMGCSNYFRAWKYLLRIRRPLRRLKGKNYFPEKALKGS